MKYNSNNRGYTLLFAVLTAALVLGVAVFILSTSRKQYILSSTARDSMYAIYAADTGIECAAANLSIFSDKEVQKALQHDSHPQFICNAGRLKYLDTNGAPIDVGSELLFEPFPSYVDSNGIPHTNAIRTRVNVSLLYGFSDYGYGCADITVITYEYPINSGSNHVIMDSRGYNLCNSTNYGPDSSPRTVERALRIVYD